MENVKYAIDQDDNSHAITGITRGSTTVITFNNKNAVGNQDIVNGEAIAIRGVGGVTSTGGIKTLNQDWPNSSFPTATVIASSTTSITLNASTSGFTSYTSGTGKIARRPLYSTPGRPFATTFGAR